MKVSICMTSYRRAALLRVTLASIARQKYPDLEVVVCEDGYDGGWTRGACEDFGARYFQRKNRPEVIYSNPAIPWNIAIKQSVGGVLILQNPECCHKDADVIEKLVAPHVENKKLAVFAAVMALNPDGSQQQWYCHPLHRAAGYFFCGSLLRSNVELVGGYDEEFGRGVGGYGYDDDFFAFQLQRNGVAFQFRDDIRVDHQWHEVTGAPGLESNRSLFESKVHAVLEQRASTSNAGKVWGSVDS